MREGKALLDRPREAAPAARTAAFLAAERRAGATLGAKEMALTRRPRTEDPARRASRFAVLARGADPV